MHRVRGDENRCALPVKGLVEEIVDRAGVQSMVVDGVRVVAGAHELLVKTIDSSAVAIEGVEDLGAVLERGSSHGSHFLRKGAWSRSKARPASAASWWLSAFMPRRRISSESAISSVDQPRF